MRCFPSRPASKVAYRKNGPEVVSRSSYPIPSTRPCPPAPDTEKPLGSCRRQPSVKPGSDRATKRRITQEQGGEIASPTGAEQTHPGPLCGDQERLARSSGDPLLPALLDGERDGAMQSRKSQPTTDDLKKIIDRPSKTGTAITSFPDARALKLPSLPCVDLHGRKPAELITT